LAIEVPVLGAIALWLLALIPAAVVTILKDRFLLFVCGFLTLGIPWIVGAISLAPPDSGWARRHYGEERLARAADPIRHRRSRRTVLLWIGGVLTSVAVLGFAAARPTPILGVSGRALQNSMGGGSPPRSCQLRADQIWRCEVYDAQYSGTVDYRAAVNRLGCWTAIRVGGAGEGSQRLLSGCITIFDLR
jgi:hypothetical protein